MTSDIYGMTNQDMAQQYLNRCAKRHTDVKRFFLQTTTNPNEWEIVANDHTLFNQVWRKMLRMAAGNTPPPIESRR